MRFLSVFVTVFSVCVASVAVSDTIRFDFEATVTTVTSSGDPTAIPDFTAGIVEGVTSLSGSFFYDPDQPFVVNGPISFRSYTYADGPVGISANVPGLGVQSFGTPSADTSASMRISRPSGSRDTFSVSGVENFTRGVSNIVGSASLNIRPVNEFYVISSPPIDFESGFWLPGTFTYSLQHRDAQLRFVGSRIVQARFTNVTRVDVAPIPSPASGILLLIGLMALPLARRKRA